IGLFERGARSNKPIATDLLRVPRPSSILWPAAPLREAGKVGVVNIATDAGAPRFLPMLYRAGDSVAQSFPLAAASAALGEEPKFGRGALSFAKKAISLAYGYQ